jgi:Flp pilus assembly protein TadD
LAVLLAATVAAIMAIRRYPYVTVGWLWYVGTLVPVIGIVKVGTQAMADRYTYIPLIGLFMIIAWGGYDLLVRGSTKRALMVLLSVLMVATLAVATRIQSRYWVDAKTLWVRALAVTTENYRAFDKLASALAELGRPDEAIPHYRESLRLRPDFAAAHNNLGNALATEGRLTEAVSHYQQALQLKPDYPLAHNGLGSALDDLGRVDEAIAQYRKALELDPEFAAAHNNLAAAFARKGKIDEAVSEMRAALQFDSDNADYHYNFAVLISQQGDTAQARRHLKTALSLNPQFQSARQALASLPGGSADQGDDR